MADYVCPVCKAADQARQHLRPPGWYGVVIRLDVADDTGRCGSTKVGVIEYACSLRCAKTIIRDTLLKVVGL